LNSSRHFANLTALIVALGGFLMGFDASVISGVVKFIEIEFSLNKIELGWSVASLAFVATFAMLLAGPASDRVGRKPLLQIAAVLFAISALWSALAGSFTELVIARMLGGLGVGAALIIAPMYIAELSPPAQRGRMVSFNQLNIVIGISAAFFSNYLVLKLGQSEAHWALAMRLDEWSWRWMLGVEAFPALLYFFFLLRVPESPRWLIMQGRDEEAIGVMSRVMDRRQAEQQLGVIRGSIEADRMAAGRQLPLAALFEQPMRLGLVIGLSVAVLQQITGINSVFFYAPMIFEQSGIGTDAAFMQAIMVGLTNLVFTVLAMALIDRIGRRPLLLGGVAGVATCMFLLAWAFNGATYTLGPDYVSLLGDAVAAESLEAIQGVTFYSDTAFRQALTEALGPAAFQAHESQLVSAAIDMNPTLILFGILGFVASFAISLGPVMWVLFSELFPNRIRGLAISFVGFVNSGVSFMVQLVFPWELANLGNALTFLIYGLLATFGLVLLARVLPETRGKTLEEIELDLVATPASA
jgi:sugar porter (SP) family MFS transporter